MKKLIYREEKEEQEKRNEKSPFFHSFVSSNPICPHKSMNSLVALTDLSLSLS